VERMAEREFDLGESLREVGPLLSRLDASPTYLTYVSWLDPNLLPARGSVTRISSPRFRTARGVVEIRQLPRSRAPLSITFTAKLERSSRTSDMGVVSFPSQQWQPAAVYYP
jgi:hypothetical protein